MNVEEIVNGVVGGLKLTELSLGSVLRLIALILAGLLAIRIIMKLLDRVLARSHSLEALRSPIRSAVRTALWLLLVLVVLGSLGVELTSIIALISVAGLAVSLALQNTLSNVAGGIMVLVSKPFSAGDFVEVDGVSGTVALSGLSYSKLVTVDNKEVYIPNSQVASAKIINYTASGMRRAEIAFSASYDAPTAEVKAALEEVLKAVPQVRADPAPEVRLAAYEDSSIRYIVRAWADTGDYWEMYYAILERAREAFDRHGVEMTYNHLNVHILDR